MKNYSKRSNIFIEFNFHYQELFWYLKHPLNKELADCISEMVNKSSTKNECGDVKRMSVDLKKIFDYAYLTSTEVYNDKCIENDFWNKYGHLSKDVRRYESIMFDGDTCQCAFEAWMAYLIMYYEYSLNNEVSSNIRYYLDYMNQDRLFADKYFNPLKEIVDKHVENNRLHKSPFHYDLELHLPTSDELNICNWTIASEYYDYRQIIRMLNMFKSDSEYLYALDSIQSAWRVYEALETTNKKKSDNYITQDIFNAMYEQHIVIPEEEVTNMNSALEHTEEKADEKSASYTTSKNEKPVSYTKSKNDDSIFKFPENNFFWNQVKAIVEKHYSGNKSDLALIAIVMHYKGWIKKECKDKIAEFVNELITHGFLEGEPKKIISSITSKRSYILKVLESIDYKDWDKTNKYRKKCEKIEKDITYLDDNNTTTLG